MATPATNQNEGISIYLGFAEDDPESLRYFSSQADEFAQANGIPSGIKPEQVFDAYMRIQHPDNYNDPEAIRLQMQAFMELTYSLISSVIEDAGMRRIQGAWLAILVHIVEELKIAEPFDGTADAMNTFYGINISERDRARIIQMAKGRAILYYVFARTLRNAYELSISDGNSPTLVPSLVSMFWPCIRNGEFPTQARLREFRDETIEIEDPELMIDTNDPAVKQALALLNEVDRRIIELMGHYSYSDIRRVLLVERLISTDASTGQSLCRGARKRFNATYDSITRTT